MNRYPFWRYALIGLALIFSLIYTLPNFYGESPAVQISSQKATIKVDEATETRALAALTEAGIPNTGVLRDDSSVKIRFDSTDTQLRARDVLEKALNPDASDPVYITALNLLSASPTGLPQLHALPMYLGLDLRGGVHFLMQIDTAEALNKRLDSAMADVRTLMRDRNVRHNGIRRTGNQPVKMGSRLSTTGAPRPWRNRSEPKGTTAVSLVSARWAVAPRWCSSVSPSSPASSSPTRRPPSTSTSSPPWP